MLLFYAQKGEKMNNQIDLMLDVLEYKNTELFEEIKELKTNRNLIKSPCYEYALTKAYKLNDVKRFRILKPLFCDKNLIWSSYYEFTIDKLTNISNIKRLKKLVELPNNLELLNSEYYKFALNNACKAKNIIILNNYVELLTNKVLLNSKYYKCIFNKAYELNNIEINNLIIKILFILENEEFKNEINDILKSMIEILNKSNKLYINYLLSVFMVKLQNYTDSKEFIKTLKKPSI